MFIYAFSKKEELISKVEINTIYSKQQNLYILDSGHGYMGDCEGNHVATKDSCFHEYFFNYEVKTHLMKMLDSSGIYYTLLDSNSLIRDLDINSRIKKINRLNSKIKKNDPNNGVLLISIHSNYSSKNPKASGIEVFINLKKKDEFLDEDIYEENMIKVANLMASNLEYYTKLPLRGFNEQKYKLSGRAKAGDIGILKRTKCYAILTENGFFSNSIEREQMNSKDFKIRVAYAHYLTICEIEKIEAFNIKKFK